MSEKPEQIEATEEKMKIKPDDKSKQKSKQDESAERPKDGQQNGNNENGNCYW